MVYCPFSTANITPEIFLGSPRPLSTDGMGTATLSPTVQSFIITRLRLTTRSSCFCCAAIESFFSCLCCSLVESFLVEVELFLIEVEVFLVEVELFLVDVESFLVEVESFLVEVESFLVEVECLVELSCWTEWLVSHLPSVTSG